MSLVIKLKKASDWSVSLFDQLHSASVDETGMRNPRSWESDSCSVMGE